MYKILKYKSKILASDAETQKRYEMTRKLSRDFTVDHPTAREIDKLLTQQMEIEEEEKVPPRILPKPVKKSVSKAQDKLADIEESFNELFQELKNWNYSSTAHSGDISASLKKALQELKIGYEHLDENLQQRFSVHPHIIKYNLDPVHTKAFQKPEIKSFQSIIDDVMMGNNVFLVGGAGTGKTYLSEVLVAKQALGRQNLTINCSQWTSPTEIIGGQTMDGYVEGKLIEAWSNGYVLILDELPKIDPNTAGLFNDALAKTKVPNAVIFNSRKESFIKHKDFACIATGNIWPDKESVAYGANNKQDLSLLDRFSGSVYFIEKNPDIEKRILQNDMLWSICDKIRSVIEELKYEAQLSLRFMQNARDTYNLEMQRVKDDGKNGVKAAEGKTFRSAVDSYISTFAEIQQKNIRDRIRYNDIFKDFYYRSFDINKPIF